MLSQKEVERLYYGLRSHINLQGDEEGQALRALSNEFILRNVNIGESLWDLDSEIGDLHFILEGTFAEYLKRGTHSFILRFYRPGKFAFSEDSLLYSNRSDTYSKALSNAKVAYLPSIHFQNALRQGGLGVKLMEVLINLSMTEYRNTTYEMLQSSGTNRIHAALQQFPDLLHLIPRRELADYLGISRASLFRSLKEIGHE
jgi:CRP-like cAMP-binding protein